ncbi:MAG: MBOAT family O-acyltransferase [Pseudomonadota bacterium]
MLFHSPVFLFVFLPITLIGFLALSHLGRRSTAIWWLIAASVAFYAAWDAAYLALPLASVVFNQALGRLIAERAAVGRDRTADRLVAIGVCANLALIGVFKYAAAVLPAALLNTAGGRQWVDLALPLGISFFTFQQIGYLLDRRRGQADAGPTRLYWLFVLFFPQMIAGPILRHRDIVPQFERVRGWPRIHLDLAVGATLFAIGLFKKVVFGDGLAALADPFFAEGAAASLGAADAWLGATIFAFALYFDFSGYCDMAIGVARLFGIRLPINFDSPFKADDILVFWRRWHITLGRFINSYVFQPLAILGARAASRRRVGRSAGYALSVGGPIFVAFLAVGLWHGAAWKWIAFGAAHGGAAAVILIMRNRRLKLWPGAPRICRQAATFTFVVATLVLFRAEDLAHAGAYFNAMAGANGVLQTPPGDAPIWRWLLAACAAFVVFAAPSTQRILKRYRPALGGYATTGGFDLSWRPSPLWAAFTALGLLAGLMLAQAEPQVFIYFAF